MTIRFSAARGRPSARLTPVQTRALFVRPANDNPALNADDTVLHDALRHFAVHGLKAAAEARSKAEQAFFAGDSGGYRHWLEICRTLDRRLARELDRVADGVRRG